MWLFTKYGFITAVSARTGDGNRNNPADPNRVIIRTRLRSHMQNLIDAFPALLGEYSIDEDTKFQRDYRFIIIVPKAVWVQVLVELGNEMDYPKFKSSIVEFPGRGQYHQHCLDIWNYMFNVQEESRE